MMLDAKNNVDALFPTWWHNYFWEKLHTFFKNKIILIGLLILLLSWIIPLVISIISNTFIHYDLSDSSLLTIPFLNDFTYHIFCIVISFSGTICIASLYQIPKTFTSLHKEGVINISQNTIQNYYRRFRKIANNFTIKSISFVLALFTGIVVFRLYYLPEYSYWWGNIKYGVLNIYNVILGMVIIYYGTLVIFLLVINSRLLIKLIRFGIKPKIFHQDRCNGLGELGNMIIYNWGVSICMILCTFVTLHYGYLNIEKSFLSKVIIAIFSIILPVIAIYPLLVSLSEIYKVKMSKLKIFGNILNERLNQIECQAISNEFEHKKTDMSNFLETQQIYNSISKMNIFPFNPKALVFVVTIYISQITITIYKLING